MVLNFLETPRAFGNPRQSIDPSTSNPVVYDQDKLIELIKTNDGSNHCFVSHQRFLSFIDRKPFEIEISKLFFDFDGKQNPPIDAYNDIMKVVDFFNDHKIPHIVCYSGMKGFHIYVPLNTTTHINGTYLKSMYRSIMKHLKRELNLTTIDPSVATPTKLCRVWYTKHPKSGRYCCPLSEKILGCGLEGIIKYSMSPKNERWPIMANKKELNIEEYIEYFDIDLSTKDDSDIIFATTDEKYNNPDNQYLREILIYPCLINSILDIDNAIHFARFATCVHLKNIGCDPLYVFNFFKQRQYMDVEFEDECKYQINTIFKNTYTFPSCKLIKESGLCVGSQCKYYRENKKCQVE